MQIGKENIESFIFDYHEGNLSDSEKTEVLNYIHNHPEYEVAFTLWAQSYLPYENTIENYGITNQLLQPSPTLWYNKSWIKIAAPTLLLAFVSFFYFTSQESITSPIQKNKTTIEASPTIKEKTDNVLEIKSETVKYTKQSHTSASISNAGGNSNNNHSPNNQTIDSSRTITPAQLNESTPMATNSTTAIQENKTISSDSATNNLNNVAPKSKTDTNKKKKSYKIQPATDFIPTNPDF